MHERALVHGLRSDGTEFPAEITISKIAVGRDTEMTAVIRDISDRTKLVAELQRAATTDSLTGIYNRRYADQALPKELQRAKRFDHHTALVMFDLDYFKNINDNYGHEKGDEVLQAVVNVTLKEIREIDIFCRWGGEEFLLILPETGKESAALLADRIRLAIHTIKFTWLGYSESISASFGVTESSAEDIDDNPILRRADSAMYAAKNSGRNCIQFCKPE